MVVHTVISPMDLVDAAFHVAMDTRMSASAIIKLSREERKIRQRMRVLLREAIARSTDERPCGAMERPTRGRSSGTRGRGGRGTSGEEVVTHKICKCRCETFVPDPQNAKRCQSCGHDVHEHQTLSRAESHRIRRSIVQEVVKEHSRRKGMEFWQDLADYLGPAG